MLGADLAALNGFAQRSRTRAQRACGLGEIQTWLLLAMLWPIAGDSVKAAQRRHPFQSPSDCPAQV
jgi:hypothetical protein